MEKPLIAADDSYFGSGSFVSIGLENGLFDNTVTASERALELGWVAGCPIPRQLIESDAPGRGAEAMEGRYGEVAFWFGQILDMAGKKNPKLLDRLMLSFPRYSGEPPIKYEPESVPDSYEDEMGPMNTLWGYAIPRVLIEQFRGKGDAPDDDMKSAQDRLARGLEILEEVVKGSVTPVDLMVNLSDRVCRADADPKAVLHHIMSQGKFEEENSRAMWELAAMVIKDQAPKLWAVYTSLTAEEKQTLDIYDIQASKV